jgi:electron transfer flavoprotein alpha subunit
MRRTTLTTVAIISTSYTGEPKAADTLKTALAMGIDRAVHVKTDVETQPLAVAKLLSAVAAKEEPKLILLGKQAIDDDSNQTGQMLAGLLGWPQVTNASEIDIDGDTLTVTREVDGGLQTLQCSLPAVVTVDLRLNESVLPATALPELVVHLFTIRIAQRSFARSQRTVLTTLKCVTIVSTYVQAALRDASQHNEGEEEASCGDDA